MTDTTTPNYPQQFDQMIDIYVKMRDRIKAADDAHKEKTRAARDYLEGLNGHILAKLNESGGESIKTEFGTAYRSEKKSATVADPMVFKDFIISNELWDMADWRANAPAVLDYATETGQLPPGVNYTSTFVVGVRRS